MGGHKARYRSLEGEADASPPRAGSASRVERWLARRLLAAVKGLPIRVVLWNGEEIGPAPAAARLIVRDRVALLKLVADPDMQFGELFADGRLVVEGDLVAFLEAVYRGAFDGLHLPGSRRGRRTNTLSNARQNVHHHYDIGNDFYRLWLDERMLYTCAYFARPGMTLEAAQAAKMEHVCRKLQLREGQSVVEAGCGWGSLALYMARHYKVHVRAYNISHEQVKLARERALAEGLDDRVEFVEDDYRNITGKYDAFVSVGMLEHVGPHYYRELGGVIDRCLSATGRGLIHSIGRNRPLKISRWIRRRIFPGGYTPSLGEMMDIFEPWSLSVLDVENLRLHYAHTLRHWLERFDQNAETVAATFDERFLRTWRLYLAGSLAAFSTGWMQLFQVVFARPMDNTVPATREHLYENI